MMKRVLLLIVVALCVLLEGGRALADGITCPAVADVYIDEWNPDENFNYKTRLMVATNKNIHHGISRSLFRFDIPANIEASQIKSAAIYLSPCSSCGGGNGGIAGFYALNKSFDEAADTWNSLAGGDGDDSVYSQTTIPKGNEWNQAVNGGPPADAKGFDITALLRGNLTKVKANGIMLRFLDEHQEPYTHQNIASRESTDALDFSPYILIQTQESLCPAEVVLQEDEEALNLLRSFRDQVLSKTPAGRNYINLYYRHAAEISALLISDADLRRHTEAALPGLLITVRYMLWQCQSGPIRDMDDTLRNLIDAFTVKASPQLREDMVKIKASLFAAKEPK